ncbi:MAG: hypothetical protein G8D88_13785 [gamma proteobacterium symbiont of Ctena orbiculata]
MLIITSSPDAIASYGGHDSDLVKVLINAKGRGNPVGLISNHPEPGWFHTAFGGTGVQFIQSVGRQNGQIIIENSDRLKLAPHDALVLASKPEDIHMGKNGGAVVVAAGWSADKQVTGLGIRVADAAEFEEVIILSESWPGEWWLTGDMPRYSVRALADLSTYGKGLTQQDFGHKVTATVKHGGARLNALLAVTARSLQNDGVSSEDELLWGVYPSSSSANDDNEVLSDFTHRLRTTTSRVRFAKKGQPLFIRHTASSKRSAGGGGDRTDPSEQIETIHLNPFYEDKNRLVDRHVIVVDDCTTYGVSFGVASAFLLAAGAAKVTNVAIGKFGNKLGYYEIDIESDPYSPVKAGEYTVSSLTPFGGKYSAMAQGELHKLIP